VPKLVQARNKETAVFCNSGNHSVLAAFILQKVGYNTAVSLKSGLNGWNDCEQSLMDQNNKEVNINLADSFLNPKIKYEQLAPQ